MDRCQNCRHFVIVKDEQGAGHGQCRSGPPTLVVQVVTQSRIVGTRCGPQTGMALLSAWRAVIANENPSGTARYWKEWLKDQEIDHHVGQRVGKRLRIRIDEEVERARTENRALHEKNDSLATVKLVLSELGIDPEHWFSSYDVRGKIQDMTEARTIRDTLDRVIEQAEALKSALTPAVHV